MAADPNVVLIRGRLTKDAETRQAKDTTIVSMRLGVTSRGKDAQGEWTDVPNYFDVTYFPRGDGIIPQLVKGKQVLVQGRLSWREWVTAEGGKRQAVEIVANDLWLTWDDKPAAGGSSVTADDIPFGPSII